MESENIALTKRTIFKTILIAIIIISIVILILFYWTTFSSQLIGTWERRGASEIWEFKDNGDLIINDRTHGWRFAGDVLIIQYKYPSYHMSTYDVVILNNEIILKSGFISEIHLIRI